ncbi:hypothetical protein BpHYR1_046820 [Brachionus plicatilis]|uniref:EF-hand domain-containing protein n=1 Tax=Brachionus plicatilis TaxID=10195 RepID=A0A3M7QYZ5_BRAPC|nr:hypothetical protein BpHYR1_046820 [Brachionus plicatilis]
MNLFSAGKSFLGNVISQDSDELFNPLPLFKQFDKNGDGKITEEGFILVNIGENIVKSVFEQIDTNGNGKLDSNEALGTFETIKSIFKQGEKSADG